MSSEHSRRGPMVHIERQGEVSYLRLGFDLHAAVAEAEVFLKARRLESTERRARAMQLPTRTSPRPRAPRRRRPRRARSTSRGDADHPPPALARAGSWLVDHNDWSEVAR